jgi:hypothetical protein
MSELQRVARGLVECLDQIPLVVEHLHRTANRCRQHAGAINQLCGDTPQGRDLALHLDAAARACDQAAHHAAQAPPKARTWAHTMIGDGSVHKLAAIHPPDSHNAIDGSVVTSRSVPQGENTASMRAEVRERVVRRLASLFEFDSPEKLKALQDAYEVTYKFMAPFMVWIADQMLIDLRKLVGENPTRRIVFVGRDGRSLAISIAELDPEFYGSYCSEVTLSRALVESALQDLEYNQGKSFPQLHGFRGAADKVSPVDRAGAMAALTDYLHDHEIPVGFASSHVTLVDTSYKGTVQELLAAIYPTTTFDGRYAFFAESPNDPHPGTKTGYGLHLNTAVSNGGIPTTNLPTDDSQIFSHQDALGSIEETLHGPKSSPKHIDAGHPYQIDLRMEIDPLDGLVPTIVSPHLRDGKIRESIMQINLIAIRNYAKEKAEQRSLKMDYRTDLENSAQRYQTQIRSWITGATVDSKLREFLDSFVRRTDKKHASKLASALKNSLSPDQHTHVWDQYRRYLSDEAKGMFVQQFIKDRMQDHELNEDDHG